jgi:HEAT repeat protein
VPSFEGRDALFSILMLVVAALFVVTLAFSLYAIGLRLSHGARDRRKERLARRWSEPLLSALGDPEVTGQLRATVSDQERLHFVGFVVQFARRLRGEGREALAVIVDPYLDRVARRAQDDSVEVSARAIQTLGMLGLPRYADTVMAALDDPSPLVAMVAARSLAQEESTEYAAAVLKRLHRFGGWNRRFLASMLAAMGPRVADTLREGLMDASGEPRARAVLAEALLLQGDLRAGDVAAAVLADSSDRDLRVATLRLLHGVGRPEHADVVRRLVDDEDEVVRAQAVRALGAVGGESDVPVLLHAMEDPWPWIALRAARAALEAGGRETLQRLADSDHPRAGLARQVLSGQGVAA